MSHLFWTPFPSACWPMLLTDARHTRELSSISKRILDRYPNPPMFALQFPSSVLCLQNTHTHNSDRMGITQLSVRSTLLCSAPLCTRDKECETCETSKPFIPSPDAVYCIGLLCRHCNERLTSEMVLHLSPALSCVSFSLSALLRRVCTILVHASQLTLFLRFVQCIYRLWT